MTVYVVQIPRRRGRDGRWEEVHDISSAGQYGRIVELFPPEYSLQALDQTDEVVRHMHLMLRNYNSAEDHILAIGPPVPLGWAMAIAQQYGNGFVRALHWSHGRYFETLADLQKDNPALG